MSKRFFRLYDDAQFPNRWYLDNPTDRAGRELDDPWQFRSGRRVQVEDDLKIPVEEAGKPLDFTFAGLSIPVIHVGVASILAELAPEDVQLIPVYVEGHPEQYVLFVATRLIRCIDETASRVRL